ncbi:TorD/DmsD family molecular chaperone [Oleidesulfovibrio sp.]|uniref:TorD/DmsD family molecular chaperone n=1 Tax=Oleidesulfovibrio sp. TaxID=2909707 RepID=UPI003A8C40D2
MQQYALALSFFARLLTQRVDEAFLHELIDQNLMDSWFLPVKDADAQQGLDLLRGSLTRSGTAGIPALNVALDADFFELFEMSPPRCYVHESVWRSKDKLFNEEETFQVKAWYAQYGLLGTGNHHGPVDHIGVEMSFVSHLLYLADSAEQSAAGIMQDVRKFLACHLMMWGVGCLDEISVKAGTDFYKGTALLAKSTLKSLDAAVSEVDL